jgi:hypothetical protein
MGYFKLPQILDIGRGIHAMRARSCTTVRLSGMCTSDDSSALKVIQT